MYASLSLIKNIPGVPARLNDVDIAVIRENTEGEYSGLEHQVMKKNLDKAFSRSLTQTQFILP